LSYSIVVKFSKSSKSVPISFVYRSILPSPTTRENFQVVWSNFGSFGNFGTSTKISYRVNYVSSEVLYVNRSEQFYFPKN